MPKILFSVVSLVLVPCLIVATSANALARPDLLRAVPASARGNSRSPIIQTGNIDYQQFGEEALAAMLMTEEHPILKKYPLLGRLARRYSYALIIKENVSPEPKLPATSPVKSSTLPWILTAVNLAFLTIHLIWSAGWTSALVYTVLAMLGCFAASHRYGWIKRYMSDVIPLVLLTLVVELIPGHLLHFPVTILTVPFLPHGYVLPNPHLTLINSNIYMVNLLHRLPQMTSDILIYPTILLGLLTAFHGLLKDRSRFSNILKGLFSIGPLFVGSGVVSAIVSRLLYSGVYDPFAFTQSDGRTVVGFQSFSDLSIHVFSPVFAIEFVAFIILFSVNKRFVLAQAKQNPPATPNVRKELSEEAA